MSITMDDVRLEVETDGLSVSLAALTKTGAKPPVVFLHGFGSTKEDFADAAFPGRLSARSIIAFDLPGCGETRCSNPSMLSMATMRAVVGEGLRMSGIQQFHLVGHSLGGLIGLLLAEDLKSDVLSFTSIEGNLSPSDCYFSRQIFTHPSVDPIDFMRGFKMRTHAEPVFSYPLYAASVMHKVRAEAAAPIFRSIVESCNQRELLSLFVGLSCPKMFLYGEMNGSLPYLKELSDHGVYLAEIPESGHFPMYSNPPAMWSVITKFMDGVDAGTTKTTSDLTLERLKRTPSSAACAADPRVRAVAGGVRPLFEMAACAGPAKTVRVEPGQNGAIHRAVHTAKSGDILVVDAGGDISHGYFGELLAICCTNKKIAGLVIDGSVRDVEDIRKLRFPVFCIAANPGQTQKRTTGDIDVDIRCGGANVSPGDIIVADSDGVAVVPSGVAKAVADAADRALSREREIRDRLNAGESTFDVFFSETRLHSEGN